MFLPDSPVITIIFLALNALVGVAIGAVSGSLASLAMKSNSRTVWKDALLGALGFFVGFTGAIYMPWHENTVTERLSGEGTVTTTMGRYQHPEWIAIVFAVALPALHELYQFRRARAHRI
jgi:hypothetical protein